jgi:flavin-dependent dehydrogenase
VGESLIPDFWKYLDRIGITATIEAENFVQKAGGVVRWNGESKSITFKGFGYSRPALHVERDRFDYLLLNHAGQEAPRVFEEVAALGATFESGDKVRVSYRLRKDKSVGEIACRYVVNASGQNAVIGRQLGWRVIDDSFRFMSVWGYFEGG